MCILADGCSHIPEECTDVVVLLLTQVVKTARWEVDIASVAADSFCGLADVVLLLSVFVPNSRDITANQPLSSSAARHLQTSILSQ